MVADSLGRLRQLASELTAAHRDVPDLAAVAAVGSVADGTADEWSDVDLHVFWNGPAVSFWEPARLQRGVEVRLRERAPEGDHAVEVWDVDGRRVEMTHYTLAALDEMATAVGQRAEPRTDYQVQMRLLLDALPLFGDAVLRERLEPAVHYPDALVATVVDLNLQFYPWAMFDVLVERDDVIFAKQVLVHTVEATMGVLIAINRIYGSPVEATSYERFIRRMTMKPADLHDRLCALVTEDLRTAAAHRRELIDEVFALVNEHVPTVDTVRVRSVYDIE